MFAALLIYDLEAECNRMINIGASVPQSTDPSKSVMFVFPLTN